MIELKNVSKTYGNSNKKAVDGLTWTVPDGAITGFIGPNGAGKTTTIHMITGVLQPDEGQILINGSDIAKEPLKAKMQFGFVPDVPDVFLRLKGIEYLNFIADLYHVPSDVRSRFIQDTAARFDMSDSISSQIISMSHGMRQKVMVMGALIHDPSVWILDEPMTGLDPKASFTLKEMMREHASAGKSVIFSTHVLEVAEKLCDQICIIDKGRQLYLGTLEHLEERYPGESLENIFLKMTGAEVPDNDVQPGSGETAG